MIRYVVPPVWFALAALLMLGLNRVFPGPVLLPAAWTWIGIAPALAGLCGAAWAVWLFRRAGTPLEPWRQPTAFVEGGPYRLTRNPMYLGLASILSGLALWLGTTTPWLGPALFVWIITRIFIHREERWLEDRYGDSYRRYKARVRRWI